MRGASWLRRHTSTGIQCPRRFSERSGGARQLAVSWHEGGMEGKEASRAALWLLDDNAKPGPMRELALTGSAAGRHSKRIPSMTFHPTAPLIVTSGEDRKIALWDYSPTRPSLVWEEKEAHETTVHGVVFNADGSLLASGGGDYRVKVWRTADMTAANDTSAPDKPSAEVKPILDLQRSGA